MTEYVFEGEVIKLNAKDFAKWGELYPSVNLTEELIQLDTEFEARKREGGKVNKWFSECIARLNGRNKRAERFPQKNNTGTRGMTPKQEFDRSWANLPPSNAKS
jgi:hypothetical protein